MTFYPQINAILPNSSTADAVQQALCEAAASFDYWLAELMVTDDPNAVHKARVALRRFRSCLHGFRDVIDPDTAATMAYLARKYFRILSVVRDRDVLVESYANHVDATALQTEAAEALKLARRSLKKKRADGFLKQVTKKMTGKAWRKNGKKAKSALAAPISTLAAIALHRTWAECMSNGVNMVLLSPRARHDLRKDLKSLRYLSEIFAELWNDPEAESFLRMMRKLQDNLGFLTDLLIAEAHGLTLQNEAQKEIWLEKASTGWAQLQIAPKWWDQPTRLP